MAPAEVTAEELSRWKHMYTVKPIRPAEVEIKHGDKTLGSKKVQLVRGLNRVAFETSIKDEAGPVVIDAEVKAADDPIPQNNKFRTSIIVQGRPKILYVEGHPQSARYLQTALTTEGLTVNTVDAASIPKTIEEWTRTTRIMLSDVARNNLSEQADEDARYLRARSWRRVHSRGRRE